MVSVSTGVFYVATTLFLIFMARWGDRMKEKELILASSYVLRGLAFMSMLWVTSALSLILVQIALGLAEAMGTPIFGALFAKHVDKKEEVLEYSDWTLVSNLVAALGTVVGGFIVSSLGFGFLFMTIGILCFISAAWIFFTPREVL